jgi:hypothetical protein
VGFEPDRDRFFQYATFVTVAITLLVCACYALLFFNPRVNPIAAMRPITPSPDHSVAMLPPTWTPTFTNTPTNTATPTNTFTPTPPFTLTPVNTLTPTVEPSPTVWYIVVTGVPTERPPTLPPPPPAPAARALPAQPTPVPSPPPQAFEFQLGRPVEAQPNCGTWYVAGTVYGDAGGGSRLNGVLVRIWANGIEQGTDSTGSHSDRPGYWEWIFGPGTAASGEVALIHPDGSPRSPRIPFWLTSDCNAGGAIQQNFIDFVPQ